MRFNTPEFEVRRLRFAYSIRKRMTQGNAIKPMPKRNTHKISKRMVDALSARGKPGVYWDRDLPGFGVRLYPTGRKTYVVQSRGPNGIAARHSGAARRHLR